MLIRNPTTFKTSLPRQEKYMYKILPNNPFFLKFLNVCLNTYITKAEHTYIRYNTKILLHASISPQKVYKMSVKQHIFKLKKKKPLLLLPLTSKNVFNC